jgi:pimeloyl-ACP methyl ester carboxylesterase
MQLEVITRGPQRGLPESRKPTPLLFVHGAWHAAWCWDEYVLPYFADRGYIAHALSLRGHGSSDGRVFGARIRHYVQDVAQVAASLPERPVVIGHSMGGYVVQKYLETHDAPAGVLIASVSPSGLIPATLRIMRAMPLALLTAALTFRGYPLVRTPAHAHFHLFSADLAADQLASYHAHLGDESMLALLDMMGLDRVRPKRITARSVPMLMIGAGADTLISQREYERMARTYGTEAVIVPDAAHGMMLESRWREAADRVVTWLGERGL